MKLMSIIIVLLFLLPSSTLLSRRRGPHGRGHMMKGMHFRQMDTNSDGKVSKKEWNTFHETMFKDMDKDKDGFIISDNFGHYYGRHRWRHMRKRYNFKNIDADDDGKISKEEWKKHYRKRFQVLDSNNDGFIESTEM